MGKAAVVGGMAMLLGLALGTVGCRSGGADSTPPPAGHAELEAGGLHWTVLEGEWRADADGLVGSAGNVLSHEDFGDALVEMDVEQTADNRPRIIGFGLRIATPPDYDTSKASGYAFHIQPNRTFIFMRGLNGQWTSLSGGDFQTSAALQPFKNHIAIRMQSGHFTITANGQPLFDTTDGAYSSGRLNFWVESTIQSVRFSNIKVTKL